MNFFSYPFVKLTHATFDIVVESIQYTLMNVFCEKYCTKKIIEKTEMKKHEYSKKNILGSILKDQM